MENPSVFASCPQCGAANDHQARQCAACGALFARRRKSWSQPIFERSQDLPSGLPLGGTAGGSPATQAPVAVVDAARPQHSWGRMCQLLKAAGETASAMALTPERAFRDFRVDGGFRRPLVFVVLLGGPCLLLGTLFRTLLSGESHGSLSPSPALALGLVFLAPPLYVYLRAQLVHLTLVLTSMARESFEGTFRLVSYANASVAPLLLLPYAGDFLFLLGGVVVEATALRLVHGLTLRQAVTAEILPASAFVLVLVAASLLGFLWWSQAQR